MHNDGYVGITFVAQLNNPLARATKKYLSLTTCIRKGATSRVDMFTYMRGLCGQRHLQYVSILKGCKSKQRRFRTNVYLHFLLSMVTQHILKFMKGNIESPCVITVYATL
jgi:hypothetical protein